MDTEGENRQEPSSLHKYVYVRDNPVDRIDPSGRADISLAGAFATAAAVIALSAIAFLHYFPTREHFGLLWSGDIDWSAPLCTPGSTPTPCELTSSQIQSIKQQALESFALAFAPYLVGVQEGRQGSHSAVVVNWRFVDRTGTEADGHTDAEGLSKVSYVHYPSVVDDARSNVGVTDIRQTVLAIGRGIGNTAAHEIGHQFGLSKMHHADDAFYEHNGASSAFFLQDQLQWTDQSQNELNARLGANQ